VTTFAVSFLCALMWLSWILGGSFLSRGDAYCPAMRTDEIDERRVVQEREGADFVAFVYEGEKAVEASWSVSSYLLCETDLPAVLHWLEVTLPPRSCWSLGVVLQPEHPTEDSALRICWIVGADVLNAPPDARTAREQHLATEMLDRRHNVTLP